MDKLRGPFGSRSEVGLASDLTVLCWSAGAVRSGWLAGCVPVIPLVFTMFHKTAHFDDVLRCGADAPAVIAAADQLHFMASCLAELFQLPGGLHLRRISLLAVSRHTLLERVHVVLVGLQSCAGMNRVRYLS